MSEKITRKSEEEIPKKTEENKKLKKIINQSLQLVRGWKIKYETLTL